MTSTLAHEHHSRLSDDQPWNLSVDSSKTNNSNNIFYLIILTIVLNSITAKDMEDERSELFWSYATDLDMNIRKQDNHSLLTWNRSQINSLFTRKGRERSLWTHKPFLGEVRTIHHKSLAVCDNWRRTRFVQRERKKQYLEDVNMECMPEKLKWCCTVWYRHSWDAFLWPSKWVVSPNMCQQREAQNDVMMMMMNRIYIYQQQQH